MKLEILNEVSLKVTTKSRGGVLFTKAGAYIGGKSFGGKNYSFEKVLLGPNGNAFQAAIGQLGRRMTGENLPLMKVTITGETELIFANNAQHIVVIPLKEGEMLSVESENVLAFTTDCKYSIRFLAQGIISQKGVATSTLTGRGPNAQVAILVDGNPLVLSNVEDGSYLTADPDAIVCWIGGDPSIKVDVSWKNFIGQASGESYMFEWGTTRATIIIQPTERGSNVNVEMDGGERGASPTPTNTFGGGLSSLFGR